MIYYVITYMYTVFLFCSKGQFISLVSGDKDFEMNPSLHSYIFYVFV